MYAVLTHLNNMALNPNPMKTNGLGKFSQAADLGKLTGNVYSMFEGGAEIIALSVRYTSVYGHKAVVIFEGSREERLGENNTIDGEGAINAVITVYGPGGEDDVKEFTGYTMTSNAEKLTPIDEGIYSLSRREEKGSGSIPKHYMVNGAKRVPTMDGEVNMNPEGDGGNYKTEIFVHGTLGANNKVGNKTSTGCLLICGSEYEEFDEQLSDLGNGVDMLLIVKRNGSDHNPVMTYPTEQAIRAITYAVRAVSTFIHSVGNLFNSTRGRYNLK